jgi:hypothetical protein
MIKTKYNKKKTTGGFPWRRIVGMTSQMRNGLLWSPIYRDKEANGEA